MEEKNFKDPLRYTRLPHSPLGHLGRFMKGTRRTETNKNRMFYFNFTTSGKLKRRNFAPGSTKDDFIFKRFLSESKFN